MRPGTDVPPLPSLPAPVQIGDGQFLAGPTLADQAAYAQKLVDTVAAQLADIASQAAGREPKIATVDGQLVEAAVPTAAIGPRRSLNTLIGGALGLALGVLLAGLPLAAVNKGEMHAQTMA